VTGLEPGTGYVFRVGTGWLAEAGKPVALFSATSEAIVTMTLAEEEEQARKREVRMGHALLAAAATPVLCP
jgi:hypothetical protein